MGVGVGVGWGWGAWERGLGAMHASQFIAIAGARPPPPPPAPPMSKRNRSSRSLALRGERKRARHNARSRFRALTLVAAREREARERTHVSRAWLEVGREVLQRRKAERRVQRLKRLLRLVLRSRREAEDGDRQWTLWREKKLGITRVRRMAFVAPPTTTTTTTRTSAHAIAPLPLPLPMEVGVFYRVDCANPTDSLWGRLLRSVQGAGVLVHYREGWVRECRSQHCLTSEDAGLLQQWLRADGAAAQLSRATSLPQCGDLYLGLFHERARHEGVHSSGGGDGERGPGLVLCTSC